MGVEHRKPVGCCAVVFRCLDLARIMLHVEFHPEGTQLWSEPHGLDHGVPSALSRLSGELGFEFLGGSVADGRRFAL